MRLANLLLTGTIVAATLFTFTGCGKELSCDNKIARQKVRDSATLFLGSIIGIFGLDDLRKLTEDCKKNKLDKNLCKVVDELNQFREGKKGKLTIVEKQKSGNELQCEAIIDSEEKDKVKINIQYSILKGTDGSIIYKEKDMQFVR